MKTLLFLTAILAAGMIPAAAQSNPSSPNGVDVEMQLAWPDGKMYVSKLYQNDSLFGSNSTGVSAYYTFINWQETAGGNGEYAEYQFVYGYPPSGPYTNLINWMGGRYPELAGGTETSISGGIVSTGTYYYPPWTGTGLPFFGSVNFNGTQNDSIQNNDQAQAMLVTGGMPGSTGTELYAIEGDAIEITYTDQSIEYDGTSTYISPEQIQVGSLGTFTTVATNYNGMPYGTMWAALPMHTEIPVSPQINGSGYYSPGLSIQPYQLVSQCEATIPTNQARTTIGVGELVDLSFNPTLPTNAFWTATGGSLSGNYGNSTTFTAPSNAANVTITATVAGQSVRKSFTVLAPSGVDHAVIAGVEYFPTGEAGAGMTNDIWISPTDVSFYRVQVMEVPEPASGVYGYFANTNLFSSDPADYWYHLSAGHWQQLTADNEASDLADIQPSAPLPPPWYSGGFSWNIPARWKVGNGGSTNSMPGWSQVFSIDGNGTVTIYKFGNNVARTTNDIITANSN